MIDLIIAKKPIGVISPEEVSKKFPRTGMVLAYNKMGEIAGSAVWFDDCIYFGSLNSTELYTSIDEMIDDNIDYVFKYITE